MPSRNVVVLSNQSRRGSEFRSAIQGVAHCKISDLSETWECADTLDGVIADVPISLNSAKQCLKDLSSRLKGHAIPILYLARTTNEAEFREARRHGATACLSVSSLPKDVVSGLFRQIEPLKNISQIMTEYSFSNAADFVRRVLDEAQTGRIDLEAIDSQVIPIMRALDDGRITHWLELIHAHDDFTVRHCLLVAGLTAHFAAYLGLSTPDCSSLVRAALLHDVGKARIPLSILNKPGPLEADELATMRTHPAIGYEMLRESQVDDSITLDVALHHHELLDGTGYPDKLSGIEITDFVRLISICDVYSALIEARPYRSAMNHSAAMNILQSMTPSKLERALVIAFSDSLSSTKNGSVG